MIHWNPTEPLIVSGSDAGDLKIWDLRQFAVRQREAGSDFTHLENDFARLCHSLTKLLSQYSDITADRFVVWNGILRIQLSLLRLGRIISLHSGTSRLKKERMSHRLVVNPTQHGVANMT